MFVGKIKVLNHISDDNIPAVTFFIHDIILIGLNFIGKPRNFSVLSQLIIIEPGTEPTGDAQIIITGSRIHRALFRMTTINKIVDVPQGSPRPAGSCFRIVRVLLNKDIGLPDSGNITHFVLLITCGKGRQRPIEGIGIKAQSGLTAENHCFISFHLHRLRQIATT